MGSTGNGWSIDAQLTMGAVRLNVGDLDAMARFYEKVCGLERIEETPNRVRLGAGDRVSVELVSKPDAPRRPPRTSGLFHLAILVPDRFELARSIRRVLEGGWTFTGASDHLVSEAMYLDDPEGNGIEIYRDRPRDEWRRTADGEIAMATLPLDVESIVEELKANPDPTPCVHPDTHIGHVHLQVSDIPATEAFYSKLLGFDVMVRSYPGALFVSAGGYHHHLGLNTWAGVGVPPPPAGARGLDRFEVILQNDSELERLESRVEAGEADGRREAGGLLVADPSENRLLLRTGD
jgi:catechol 2,3-dioxygenase